MNPEGAKAAGPLLYGWARRTARTMASTPRQVRALVSYLPLSSSSVYASLGGDETLQWAQDLVSELGMVDKAVPIEAEDEIHVLGLPYGGPNGGKDDHGQYFSQMTDFMDGVLDSPPVMYVHGSSNGFETEPVGQTMARWYDQRGGWFKIKLDPQSPRYSQLIDAKRAGTLFASTGVVPAAFDVADSGHINTWLVGELSLVDKADGWKPVNGYAVTKAMSGVLFEDYYGDPVKEGGLVAGIVEALQEIIARFSPQPAAPIEKAEPVAELPIDSDVSLVEENPMSGDGDTEKCESCDEAKRLADLIKAELDAPVKCARCPEAVTWVGSMLKAGRMAPAEARAYLDQFVADDSQFETVKATVEARPVVTSQKAQPLFVAGGTSQPDVQTTVDEDWMAKQRRLAGIKK